MTLTSMLYIFVMVLLPIVPAYLLYRGLPSKGEVSGPWKGLQIKLSGAFAGYFLLVLLISGFSRFLPTHEVWRVRGQLQFSDGGGIMDERTIAFILRPSDVNVFPDGSFDIAVFAAPDLAGGSRLPRLIIEHAGYIPATIDLEDDPGIDRQSLRKRVHLTAPLVLNPKPGGAGHGDPD